MRFLVKTYRPVASSQKDLVVCHKLGMSPNVYVYLALDYANVKLLRCQGNTAAAAEPTKTQYLMNT